MNTDPRSVAGRNWLPIGGNLPSDPFPLRHGTAPPQVWRSERSPAPSRVPLLFLSAHLARGVAVRLMLLLLGVLPLVLAVPGCGGPADNEQGAAKTKAAIERVFRADDKLAKERERLPPKATPSQIAWSFGVYCDALERLDTADCPADFRVAFGQHIRAWREAQVALQQLPDGFLEGLLMGALNSVLRGENDGGTSRLEGELKRTIERVRTTYEEVEKIGAKYGVAL
jgi:hypothetical protein